MILMYSPHHGAIQDGGIVMVAGGDASVPSLGIYRYGTFAIKKFSSRIMIISLAVASRNP